VEGPEKGGFRLRQLRPLHRRGQPHLKALLKKRWLRAWVRKARKQNPERTVRVFAQDEARLGLKPITRRMYIRKGQPAVVRVDPRYEWRYAFSAVEPSSGETFSMIWSTVNLKVMQEWVNAFSQWLAPGDVAILVMDRAGWHSRTGIQWPANVIPKWLPPYSPDCNPAERLWTWVRERLANVTHETIEVLEDRLADALRLLARSASEIRSLVNYHWWEASLLHKQG
jgi:transposase